MLGERDRFLLKKLVELYLKEGKPVGSRTLSKLPDISVSPATIRNVMADLETAGLIQSPHTSAGRVPTSKGLRFYVDQFVTYQPLSREVVMALSEQLRQAGDAEDAIERANQLLSELTNMVSVVLLPDRSCEVISHLALMPLSEHKLLLVLVFDQHDAENRFVELERPMAAHQVVRLEQLLQELLVGQSLVSAHQRLMSELAQLKTQLNDTMKQVGEVVEHVLSWHQDGKDQVCIAGKSHLIRHDELADVQRLRALLDTFETHRDMLYLLDRSLQAKGLKVFIGRETGIEEYAECAVVTHPYYLDENMIGVLGVIGPQRMPYEKVIPLVDVTAKMLDSVLKKQYPTPLTTQSN